MELAPLTDSDLPRIHELHRRCETFDNIPGVTDLDELTSFITGARTDLAADTRMAETNDGSVVGYVHTYHLPSDVRLERCYVFGQVDPRHRRQGIGTKLMSWAIDRARTRLLSSDSSLPKVIRTDQFDFVDGPPQLYQSLGLTPVRVHEQMRRPLGNLPEPIDPDGISIVAWPVERNDELRTVKNAAFADHWGSTPAPPDMWRHYLAEPSKRLDLSHVAVTESGDIVGYALNDRFPSDDELLGRREGWIDNLGTLAQYRGRGIASALIVRSLHSFAAAGLTHACLDVDSDSLTGARRLYASLGFVTQTRTVTYELDVT